jgi:hypothetical protein
MGTGEGALGRAFSLLVALCPRRLLTIAAIPAALGWEESLSSVNFVEAIHQLFQRGQNPNVDISRVIRRDVAMLRLLGFGQRIINFWRRLMLT